MGPSSTNQAVKVETTKVPMGWNLSRQTPLRAGTAGQREGLGSPVYSTGHEGAPSGWWRPKRTFPLVKKAKLLAHGTR